MGGCYNGLLQKGKIIGVCGLTLLGLMTLNSKTVHADAITWNNGNANNNALESNITSSDSSSDADDRALESNIKASDSVKANNSVTTRKDIKTSHVNANAPIQKTKVAQFNNGSEIYSLDNGNTLSKSNGAGYVITNAGTYNGRQVDIGVTINNVQDNQGSYTTKWSNGDKADVTGKGDNQFNYQNSALVGTTSKQPRVDLSKTRTRMANQSVDFPYKILLTHAGYSDGGVQDDFTDDITNSVIFNYGNGRNSLNTALSEAIANDISSHNYYVDSVTFSGHDDGSDISSDLYTHSSYSSLTDVYVDEDYLNKCLSHIGSSDTITALKFISSNGSYLGSGDHIAEGTISIGHGNGKYKMNKQTPVTDHLQSDKITPASLNYDYTIGVYDAQTGELIDGLVPVYKGKAGSKATSSDSGMNNAIKNKILQINNHQAHSAFTGNQANDDVAFYLETQAVQDSKQLTANASRIITFNLPSSVNKTNYAKLVGGTVNGNQVDITDNLRFTRTGTTNLANNKTTYTKWVANGEDSFPSHTIVRIPGYTLTINK